MCVCDTHRAVSRNGGDVAKHNGLSLHVPLQQSNHRLHNYTKLVPRSHMIVELGHAHHHLQIT